MDSVTEAIVGTALAELNKTGVSYVLMIEDDAGAPAFFYNDPKTHYYLISEKNGE